MSEPKCISPLLDGFTIGNPMSDHDGVCCCPAVKENTDKKYIVKIISVPASQVQMDALLLAGAYKDPAGAMDYYKTVADDVVKEAETLQSLSKLDGFLPYEEWQIEPITRHRLGYQVYLISSYKRALDKYVRRNPVTHLEAVNLGLDMCAALSVARQAGYLYVDLKPSNIFISEKKEYRIGDLGLISLDSLQYASLPDKYRSPYTPPELHDPMTTVNDTADTYALGMILYQLYNDGQLPFKDQAPLEALPSPVNADYEIAEIIMKAIHPDPQERWRDPKEMGQVLVAYMQRNAVNDTPITPHTPLEIEPEEPLFVPEKKNTPAEAAEEAAQESTAEASSEEPVPQQEASQNDMGDEAPASEDAPSEEPASEEIQPDETVPSEADAESLQPHEMSDELSRIVAKADDLITHETPEGVVIPEAPELPDPFAFIQEDMDEVDLTGVPEDPVMEEPEEEVPEKKQKGKKHTKPKFAPDHKKKVKRLVSVLVWILVLVLIGGGVFWGYQNYYLQTIDALTIRGERDQLVVSVDTNADETLLTVTCSDNYGNIETKDVVDGKAVFTDLKADTLYKIQLEIEGFHKLVGQTSDIFTTEAVASLVSFTAVTGPEDGSVILNFTIDGTEPEEWTMVYSTEGEETRSEVFTGHTVTISGLSIGKVYTFTLEGGEFASSSQNSLEFMASRLILAEDLNVTSSTGSEMTVTWKAPGDIIVDSWNVRCYSDSGYEQNLTVTGTEASFSNIDPTVSYTVEVTASGMTQPARTSITANPINVSTLTVAEDAESAAGELTVSWAYTGAAPAGGWLLLYSVDGSNTQNVVKTEEPTAAISPRIPGAKYSFVLQAADGTSIFNNTASYTCPEPEGFEIQGLSAEDVTVNLLVTPDNKNWTYESVGKEAFTDTFASGEKISIVLSTEANFYVPAEPLDILYVIRDAYGNVISELVSEETSNWKDLWYSGNYHYGELDLPTTPTAAGSYSLSIYFNHAFAAAIDFTISE